MLVVVYAAKSKTSFNCLFDTVIQWQTVVCENVGPFLMIQNFNDDSLRG